MDYRIGHGFDVHQFVDGNYFMLGGVKIVFTQGIAAHSDGDVLLHALSDALLGALALGDLGQHFPSSDAAIKGIDSRDMLRKIVGLVAQQHYHVANVDTTVVLQQPKLVSFIDDMRANIATDLAIHVDQVSVKATTTDHLGFVGRGEGIMAFANVMVLKT